MSFTSPSPNRDTNKLNLGNSFSKQCSKQFFQQIYIVQTCNRQFIKESAVGSSSLVADSEYEGQHSCFFTFPVKPFLVWNVIGAKWSVGWGALKPGQRNIRITRAVLLGGEPHLASDPGQNLGVLPELEVADRWERPRINHHDIVEEALFTV
jgi:hypothetical protein